MPQFTRRSQQPPSPESYRAVARKLRQFADKIEAAADPQTPRERATLTRLVHALSHFAHALVQRHQRGEGP